MDWVNWVIDNKQWLFSGIGVVVVTSIIGWIVARLRRKIVDETRKHLEQAAGDNSTNIQVGDVGDNANFTLNRRPLKRKRKRKRKSL